MKGRGILCQKNKETMETKEIADVTMDHLEAYLEAVDVAETAKYYSL